MKKLIPNYLLASVLAGSSVSIYAATSNSSESASSQTVVVTANRTAKTVDDTISSVVVIEEEDIQRSQARSVPELLRGLSGVQFTNNGGRGKVSSLFLRGTNSDHVIVLIDGIKVGSATSGTVPFQDLPIDQIERIELVRGARSSLYGSEAIGGVIQIFTRKNTDGVRKFASASIGAQDTYEGSVGVSAGNESGAFYNLSVSGTTTSGFDSCKKEAAGTGGCYTDEPDNDGYESFSGNLKLGKEFANGSQFSISGQQTQNKNEYDGGFQNGSESLQRAIGVASDLVIADNYSLKLSAGQSRDNADNYRNDAYVSKFNTQRDTVSIQNDLQLNRNLFVTYGGDYQRDEVSSTTAYPVTERENFGGFLQTSTDLGALNFEAAVRHDDNEQYGSQKTYSGGVAYRINDQLQLIASYGTAFKAPTFNQLYFPFYGSPNLKPEESTNIEYGLRTNSNNSSFAVTYFRTDVDDLIVYDSSTFAANNINQAEIEGFELEFAQQVNAFLNASLDLTLMDPINKSDGQDGNLLPRRAKRSARLDLDYAKNDWMVGVTMNMVGSRYDDAWNTRKLKAYKTIDLKASKDLTPEWRLQARLTNLTDTDYETAAFYNQQERSLLFTVRYQPQ